MCSKVLKEFPESIIALIIELNGSGKTYGFTDNDVHNELLLFGYFPVHYNPFSKTIEENDLNRFDGDNIIYVKDIKQTKIKCNKSKSRVIHAAHNIRI